MWFFPRLIGDGNWQKFKARCCHKAMTERGDRDHVANAPTGAKPNSNEWSKDVARSALRLK